MDFLRKRIFTAVILLIIIEFLPWAGAVWPLFSGKTFPEFLQERGIAMTIVIYFCAFIYLLVVFVHEVITNKKNYYGAWTCILVLMGVLYWNSVHKNHSIVAQNGKYEAAYKAHDGWGAALCTDGENAFLAGDYAYSIMFYDEATNTEPRWPSHAPLYYTAIFAQNPTSKGRQQFEQNLNQMVANLRAMTKSNGLHGSDEYFRYLEKRLAEARNVVPPDERNFTDAIIEQVKRLKPRSNIP